jgi:hypothetical protein
MKCARCRKALKKGYYYNGMAYGPDCINKIAGRNVRLSKLKQITITKNESESDLQMGLFDEIE